MQYSKSFAYFAPSERQREVSTQTRAQRRSSLDTFVIPGRTRLPSSKASSFDIQVTQGLLNSNLPQDPRQNMTSAENQEWFPETSHAESMLRRGANPGPSGPLHQRMRPDMVKRPPPRFGGREVIIVPPQRPRPNVPQPASHTLAPALSQGHVNEETYDGADDSAESRLTSTTWSTVSHRVFSDSSGSSRATGASYYREEYNKLAKKHEMPRLEAAPDDDENHSQTKTTTKTHHTGWLARKLFRRSSSTYTLKAKTTYKPISKKKSFGGIPGLSEDRHKNILKGKSLEELSRLGGLSVLVLPPDFAVDTLILPACLSATATYLYQHGCNAPGIFRVSGQTTIVNALYDFYDHQFANADAGSPSKVEQTVGSGLLPSHIEHTVPDVASFFKRVLIDLPGGLLGSIELFEALRNITTNLGHDQELSKPELASIRTKMVALAISSVASDYRLYLIQAVLGLVSYLGHEAEKLEVQTASANEEQAPSELMNYRSLGVVLGPLLLGNLTDRAVHGGAEGQNGNPRTSPETDSAKKFRKHKRKHSDMKLDQNATLAAFVDRANRTAIVMQQLLLMWPDVVKQLRDINSTASSSLKSRSRRHLKKTPSHTGSRLTLKTSEEEMRFLDILRGRTLPEEFRGAVRMQSNIRITSRSPMSRGVIGPSGDEHPNDTWEPAASEEHSNHSSGHTRIAERAARDDELAVSRKLRSEEEKKPFLADDVVLGVDNRTPSDIAMDKMAMGTILPPLQIKPSSSSRKGSLRHADPGTETPGMKQNSRSSSETPQTALRDAPPAEHSHGSEESQLQISMRKPLPPIRDDQRVEQSDMASEENVLDRPSRPFATNGRPALPYRNVSSSGSSNNSFSNRKARRSAESNLFLANRAEQMRSSPTKPTDAKAIFPPRQSSLPVENHLTLKPIETYATIAEYKAKADTYMSPPKLDVSMKASEVKTGQSEEPPKPNNVKALAQRFTEASRAMRRNNEQAKETSIPRIHALVKPLPAPKSPMLDLDDPFVSAESSNVSKESLIPKPVRDVGRSRESRSLSPPKRVAPKAHDPKRRSAIGIGTDRDAEIVQNNTIVKTSAGPNTAEGETYDQMNVNSPERLISKQSLSELSDAQHYQRSVESLRRCTCPQESLQETRHLHNRTISFAELTRSISPSRPGSPSFNVYAGLKSPQPRSNSYLDASDALKPLERHGSINATMYREICRLQRLLQQMGEEREGKDRRIEALEEVQGVNPVAAGVKANGSFGKGGLHNEIRKKSREVSYWKTKAELLQRRLSGLEQLSGKSRESETVFPEYIETTERSEIVEDQDDEKEMCHIRDLHGDSPNSWKWRASVAESELARIAPAIGKVPHSDMARTVPSPTSARVHVAFETESGEKEEGFWDWRGEESRNPSNADFNRSSSENKVDRRPDPVKRSRGSDDESSDFASASNSFG